MDASVLFGLDHSLSFCVVFSKGDVIGDAFKILFFVQIVDDLGTSLLST